jgi:endonuclease III
MGAKRKNKKVYGERNRQTVQSLDQKLVAREVSKKFKREYGSPRLNNKEDPVDELFFIILSQMTTAPSYERVFDRLKSVVKNWDDIISIPMSKLKYLIADAGLSNQKAPRLKAIARKLKSDFGKVTLEPVAGLPDKAIEDYLTSLPAVGIKTAKCVMMYSMGRKVLPVDTHVARVARRLGLLTNVSSQIEVHNNLETVIARHHRYDFHVNAIAHGRAICRAKIPLCHMCMVHAFCVTGAKNLKMRRGRD